MPGMAQDLRTISQEAFKIQLFKLSNKQLLELLESIYGLKTSYGHVMRDDEVQDIERKETKINAELMRRGFLKKSDYEDYFGWLKKINRKKKVW